MSNQNKGLYASDQNNSSNPQQYNSNTLNVVRSGPLPGQDADGNYYGCYNFIGRMAVVLKTATVIQGQGVLYLNTGLAGDVSVSADNGGTFDGEPIIAIPSGPGVFIFFDGTNFTSQLNTPNN
jgi:hypothetical protein